jgi:hypothetical protein
MAALVQAPASRILIVSTKKQLPSQVGHQQSAPSVWASVNDLATSASHRQRINAPRPVIQHIPRITPSQYDSAARGLGHFDPRKLRRSCATCASRDRYVNRKSKHRTVTGNCSAHKRRLIMYIQSGDRRIDVLRADPHPPMVSPWDHRLEITGRATLGKCHPQTLHHLESRAY